MPEKDIHERERLLRYEVPTLTRIPVGETAAAESVNSDVIPFAANTAYPPGGAES